VRSINSVIKSGSIFVSVFLLALLTSTAAFAFIEPSPSPSSTQTRHKQQTFASTPVKSAAQLERHLKEKSGAQTPLAKLSAAAKSRFIESLTFNHKGLTGLYYLDLKAELSFTDVYSVLALFGQQHLTKHIADMPRKTSLEEELDDEMCDDCFFRDWLDLFDDAFAGNTPDDHKGYQCISPGTCKVKGGYICLSTC
jgi:hypothetical protein